MIILFIYLKHNYVRAHELCSEHMHAQQLKYYSFSVYMYHAERLPHYQCIHMH